MSWRDDWKNETRTCEWCKQKTFKPKSNSHIYCGSVCENAARVKELKVKVYSMFVRKSLGDVDEKKDLTFEGYEIEGNRGRIDKALRILEDTYAIKVHSVKTKNEEQYEMVSGNYTTKTVKVKHYKYAVVDINDARQYMEKPVPDSVYTKFVTQTYNSNGPSILSKIDYKSISRFSETEQLYIFFNLNEFNVMKQKIQYRNSSQKVYYLNENLTFRHKMVLKCLVENELKFNFPQYIHYFCGTEETSVVPYIKHEFTFHKYAISSIFDVEKSDNQNGRDQRMSFDDMLKEYTEHYEHITRMKRALDKAVAWVKSVSGHKEAIKIIRKKIIEDMSVGHILFNFQLMSFDEEVDPARNKLAKIFPFIQEHKDIFTYESLYGDPLLGGEEVPNCVISDGWNNNEVLESINFKEEFNEPGDEGDVAKDEAA